LQHLYWDIPSFKETTEFEHIKKHYFTSLTPLNPEVRLSSHNMLVCWGERLT
jgi:glutathionyl-hydroquinone reductase